MTWNIKRNGVLIRLITVISREAWGRGLLDACDLTYPAVIHASEFLKEILFAESLNFGSTQATQNHHK